MERRGYFFVDKIELQNQKMTLNFIPDGKTKNMSVIESKLDQKQVAGGKTDAAVDKAKDKKKSGGDPASAEGLSKKELNKLKKKEEKAAKTAAAKAGTPLPPKVHGKPGADAAKSGSSKAKEAGPLVYGTMPDELTAALNKYEATLSKQNFLNGA